MAFIEYKEIEITEPRKVRSLLIGYCMENMKGMTKSAQAYAITDHAIRAGYTENRASIYGLTLDDIFKKKKGPWWMSKAALDVLVEEKWVPSSAWQWASFANAWLYAKGPFNSLDEVLESLPAHIKHEEAKHWFEKLSARFCISDATKPVSRIVDKNNRPLTLNYLSSEKAKQCLINKYSWSSWEEAEKWGCKIDHYHALICDLLNDRKLTVSDRSYLIKHVKSSKMLSYIKLPAKSSRVKYRLFNLIAIFLMLKRCRLLSLGFSSAPL